jgi:toxin ParE1/3/4
MPARLIQRADARRDLREIALFLGRDSPRAADRFLAAVERTSQQLLATPELGSRWEGGEPTLPGLRMKQVRGFTKYWIFYRPTSGGIEIVRVLHSARDLDSLLRIEE